MISMIRLSTPIITGGRECVSVCGVQQRLRQFPSAYPNQVTRITMMMNDDDDDDDDDDNNNNNCTYIT